MNIFSRYLFEQTPVDVVVERRIHPLGHPALEAGQDLGDAGAVVQAEGAARILYGPSTLLRGIYNEFKEYVSLNELFLSFFRSFVYIESSVAAPESGLWPGAETITLFGLRVS